MTQPKHIPHQIAEPLSGAVFNKELSSVQGGRFELGFISAFTSSLALSYTTGKSNDPFAIMGIGAAIGGTAESLGGGKFANGAVTGAFVGLFNHGMHLEETNSNGQEIEMIDVRIYRTAEELYAELRYRQENIGEYTAYEITRVSNNAVYYVLDNSSNTGVDGDYSIVRTNILDIIGGKETCIVTAVIHSHPGNSPYATGYDLKVFSAFPSINRIEIVYGSNNQVSVYNNYGSGKNFDRTIQSYDKSDRLLNTYRYDRTKIF